MRGSLKITLAAAAVATALSGCGGPVEAGAAALVGDERISTATLNAAVRDWQREFRADPVANQMREQPQSAEQQMGGDGGLSESDMRGALAVLVNFRVADEVARRSGVTVTDGHVDQVVAAMDRQGGARSTTLANGLPSRHTRDLARFLATRALVTQKLGGGTDPQSPASAQARQMAAMLFVSTAGKMKIKVNPRFGGFDPQRVSIEPVRYHLSATETGIR
ncbi:hypothetical protein ACSNOI_22610 [Actinomadura kijaniata]|uniref:hypothetical protein n=1 Tax=Actinomadura kijaniata TaxID=46161 RepID=UPI003F1B741A